MILLAANVFGPNRAAPQSGAVRLRPVLAATVLVASPQA